MLLQASRFSLRRAVNNDDFVRLLILLNVQDLLVDKERMGE